MPWTVEEQAGVAIVTMNSNKVNAQNEVFFSDLDDAFDRLERNHSDCAVVLTGQSACFSAGLDFDEHFPLFARGDLKEIARWFDRYRATNLRIFTYPRPTVAAIGGHAYAGGLITALNCDFRIAADSDVAFSLNEVPIGIPMPAVYVEIIRYAVGVHSAALISLVGQVYGPTDAFRLGLVHELTPKETVLTRAIAMARAVSPDCFEAYAFTKRALQAPTLRVIEDISSQLEIDLPRVMSCDGSLRAHAIRYRELKGREPTWATRQPLEA